jgi:light-regulated signal transduction histidine kinase (bacteriophytochrome)
MVGVQTGPGAVAEPDPRSCDREPIHVPGSIQPYGALFVVEPASGRVLQAAVGAGDVGRRGEPVGRNIIEVLGPEAAELLDGMADRLPASGVAHLGVLRTGGAARHLLGHWSDGAITIELESSAGREVGFFDEGYHHVREFLDRLQRIGATEELASLAAREVRRIAGLDQVLVYRLDESWNGTVIAEERDAVFRLILGREELFVTDSLAAVMPDGEVVKQRASGVLAISISQLHDSYVLWFHHEVIRTVTWGGDPSKPVEGATGELALHPRRSFERWQETVRLRGQPWHPAEIALGSAG